MGFFDKLGRSISIDLGTANTLVYVSGKGIVLQEPSVIAIRRSNNKILAVGAEAKAMLGRAPGNVIALRPLRDGVIADFDTTQKMLEYFIQKVYRNKGVVKPRVVVTVPCGVTGVEKRAVKDAAQQAGAREALTIEEPMAAAIGAGLPVYEATGNLVVDVGGGTTEIALISLGGIVVYRSLRMGGDRMDDAIINYLKHYYNLAIGERTAEHIKISIGSALAEATSQVLEVRGRDLLTGLPKSVVVDSQKVQEALEGVIVAIIEAIKYTLERTPPELASDIMDKGILLTGGGALLNGLDQRIREETSIPVIVADNPLTAVVCGAGKYLEYLSDHKSYIHQT